MLNSSWRVQLKNVARVQKKSFNHIKKNIYCHYSGLVYLWYMFAWRQNKNSLQWPGTAPFYSKQLYFVSGFKFFSGPKYRRLILQIKISVLLWVEIGLLLAAGIIMIDLLHAFVAFCSFISPVDRSVACFRSFLFIHLTSRSICCYRYISL